MSNRWNADGTVRRPGLRLTRIRPSVVVVPEFSRVTAILWLTNTTSPMQHNGWLTALGFNLCAEPLVTVSVDYQVSCNPLPAKFIRRCHPFARKSASRAVLRRMQLILHATRRTPHGASCLVLSMSAWSVETRRTPSRHCSDAGGYAHTTTAMRDNEHTPPPLSEVA